MKKLPTFLILTYLLFTINSGAVNQNSSENNSEDEKVLKIGVLLPLSGEFQTIGQTFLNAIQLALYDISDKNIKIYLKDSKANALDTYKSAKEFEEMGLEIVIGLYYQPGRYGFCDKAIKKFCYGTETALTFLFFKVVRSDFQGFFVPI